MQEFGVECAVVVTEWVLFVELDQLQHRLELEWLDESVTTVFVDDFDQLVAASDPTAPKQQNITSWNTKNLKIASSVFLEWHLKVRRVVIQAGSRFSNEERSIVCVAQLLTHFLSTSRKHNYFKNHHRT